MGHLLCAKQCSTSIGYITEQNKDSCPFGIYILIRRRQTINKNIKEVNYISKAERKKEERKRERKKERKKEKKRKEKKRKQAG